MDFPPNYWPIILMAMLTSIVGFGQLPEASVKKFDAEHGLHTHSFKKVLEDGSNFVWVMYEYGIQRFDGTHTDDYFKGEEIVSMVLDGHCAIWVSTKEGVYKYDNHLRKFLHIRTTDPNDGPKLLFYIDGRPLHYMGKSGIFEYDLNMNTFRPSQNLNEGPGKNVKFRYTRFTHFGHILYYTDDNHVWRHNLLSGKKDTLVVTDVGWVHAISKDEIVTTNWEAKTWYYNFSTRERIRLKLPGPDSFLYVHDAFSGVNGIIYLASSNGLLRLDLESKEVQKVVLTFGGLPFPETVFRAVYQHKKGHLWVATENSLLRVDRSEAHIRYVRNNHYDSVQQFDSRVRSFAADDQGNLWLATGHGLTQWNLKQHTFHTLEASEGSTNGLDHASIRGLVYDGTHLIIGQTNKGIWLFDPKRKTFKRPLFADHKVGNLLKEKISQDFINQIKTLRNGDHIISARDGAYLMDGTTYAISEIDFPGSTHNVTFSYEDRKGTIFIGTLNGLFCLNADYTSNYEITEQIDNSSAFCVLEHGNGHYLGTHHGLYFLSTTGDTLSVKKTIPELQDASIQTLFKDNQENLWLVSENKLYRLENGVDKPVSFGHTENVLGDYFYPNSYYRNEEGLVFIGGISGINYFYPEKVIVRPKKLHPYLRRITFLGNSKEINELKKLELAYNQRNITLAFATPYYGNPSDVQYRYRLTENGDWFDLGTNSNVTLWRLPSGDYRFQIAASVEEGVWHNSSYNLQFTIEVPFWKSWWFTTSLAILTLLLLFLLFAFQRRKLEMEKQLKGFATSLYGQNTVDGILWATARYCVQELNFVDCVIYLLDEKRELLLQKVAFGIKNPYGKKIINKIEIPLKQGIVGAVAYSGIAERIKNTAKDPRYILDVELGLSEITIPVFVDNQVFAVLDSEHPKRNFYRKHHLELLKKIAAICSERLTKYLSEEKLRGTIARDLHDEMGSTLTSIHIISKIAEQDAVGNSTARKQFGQINKHASGMMEKMSDMVWVVNPANDGLDKLIFKIKEYAIEVLEPLDIVLRFKSIKGPDSIKLSTAQRKNTYLIAKEVVNNIVKHSLAKQVVITYATQNDFLSMTIEDDGKGFEIRSESTGNGLKNLHKRAEEIDAILLIASEKDKGVSVCLKIKKESLVIEQPLST